MSSSTSSVSSHLCNIAQAWNQQLVSRDRQTMHEESREAITHDSISSLPFDNPLVDPCGHTFSRSSVMKFKELSPGTRECPLSRRAIRIDQFVPDIYAQNVLNYFGEEARRASSSTAMSSTSAESTTSSTRQSGPTLALLLAKIDGLGTKINTLTTKVDNLNDKATLLNRQISNMSRMNCCDHLKAMVSCGNYMDTVRYRGFTDEEKRKVNT